MATSSADDRLKLGHWAAWVLRIVLRIPDHFASIVDHVGGAVGASQRRQLGHHAVLPQERETCSSGGGKPIRGEAAKVLVIRNGSLSLTHGLAPFVDAERYTVRSSESRCADVHLQSLVPEDGLHFGVDGRPAAYQTIIGNKVLIPWAKFPSPGAIPPRSMTA